MTKDVTKIGVLLTALGGLDTRALRYLILHQNSLQQSFEFQLLATPRDDALITLLNSPQPINRPDVEAIVNDFISRYRADLRDRAASYQVPPILPASIVILTTARFSDNYFATGGPNWGLLALGNWERHMAPPSIVEFFLALLVRSAIDTACKAKFPVRHFTTNGCLFDFAASIGDARFGVLSGHICQACRETILSSTSSSVLEDSLRLAKKDWLGDYKGPSGVANTAKKLGYDLFHTSGIQQTLWEKVRARLEEEVVKTLLKIIGTLAIAALLVWLGIKS